VAARERSVQVNPFINETHEPHLTDTTTQQLRKALQQDGTYNLATHDDGDLIVNGEITSYSRHEMTVQSNDNLTMRDYRLMLTVHVTVKERGSGKILLDQPVKGFTIVQVNSDLTSSERQALPLLAADVAQHVTALLVEGSW
jgi:hypothetical protein